MSSQTAAEQHTLETDSSGLASANKVHIAFCLQGLLVHATRVAGTCHEHGYV